MSHLIVAERKDRPGTFQISGTVPGFSRLRQNAKAQAGKGVSKAQARKLAEDEARLLEAEMVKVAVYGPGPDGSRDRLFAEIAQAYLDFEKRHPAQVARVDAVIEALGREARASTVTQEKVDELKKTMLRTQNPARNTIKTVITTPITSILNFGARRRWCERPVTFEVPKDQEEKLLKVMLPGEAHRLINAAVDHLKAPLITMFGIGSRVSETLNLEWENVDLPAAKATYLQKGGRWRRGVHLPPAVVTALANLSGPRTGRVFRHPGPGGCYRNAQMAGGQIKNGFAGALRRAGLSDALTPHACRHSYASWHMAVWKNPLKLKFDGGWDSVGTLEIYMHLVPEGCEAEILRFWGYANSDTRLTPALQGLLLSA